MGSLFKNFLSSSTKTEQGEVTVNINLMLTLKIEQDGNIRVVAAAESVPTKEKPVYEQNETAKWELPDLDGDNGLINFGKHV